MNITIIGGGITGLSTALALHQAGHEVSVYEKAPAIQPVGAGIWMAPNAMKVLNWLGVGEQVKASAAILKMAEITDRKLRPLRSDQSIAGGEHEHQRIVSIHRAHLQGHLYEALPKEIIHLGHAYQRHEVLGEKVRVYLEGLEAPIETDLLLGADGLNSAVRRALFPDSELRYSGQTCWRGVAPFHLDEQWDSTCREAWGPGLRFGFSDIGNGKVYWFAVAKAPQSQTDPQEQRQQMLLKKFSPFAPLITDLIAATPTEAILRHDLSDLKRIASWSKGPVGLLGDAAHATTPNMGQGAAQGIEDAYAFAQAMSEFPDPVEALQQFEQRRRPKVDRVVNTSWQIGQVAHHPIGQPVARLAMRLTPTKVLNQQMKSLYAVEGMR